jgi:16S rRNA G966 N2-methylase RsmD
LHPGAFEVVFLDPPYESDAIVSSLEAAAPLVAPAGLLILEHARRDAAPARAGSLTKTRDIMSGDRALSFYQPDG